MSLSRWYEGSDPDRVTGLNRDDRLVGHRKIPALQRAKLPRYGREGAVEVRPFPAETKLCASLAQGLSGEAVKGNPTPTVIPGVDKSKPSHRTTEDLTEPFTLPACQRSRDSKICPSRGASDAGSSSSCLPRVRP
jgi:hypothetical protein